MSSEVKIEKALHDFKKISEEYAELEAIHKKFVSMSLDVLVLQKKCLSNIGHQYYILNSIKQTIDNTRPTTKDEKDEIADLNSDMIKRRSQLAQMEENLPRESGIYLKTILGDVNVSILDKEAKFHFKEQYEQFKLVVTTIACAMACLNLYVNNHILDLVFMFLMVWYYCTLTIRESILIVNGSKIKGWWRTHHFISSIAGGILLVWVDEHCYQLFRPQLMWFNVYLAFVQYVQFTYQKGCLYRLRSLGERNSMDITVDGFHSWMWKGLGFIMPILFIGYIWQLYNSYSLYLLSFRNDATWQVSWMSAMFFILGLGNIITASLTIPKKIRDKKLGILSAKFTRLDKYFWSHKKRRNASLQQEHNQEDNIVLDESEKLLNMKNTQIQSDQSFEGAKSL